MPCRFQRNPVERELRCRDRRCGFSSQAYAIHSFIHSQSGSATVTLPSSGDARVNNIASLHIGYFIEFTIWVTSGKSLNFFGPQVPYQGHSLHSGCPVSTASVVTTTEFLLKKQPVLHSQLCVSVELTQSSGSEFEHVV